MKTILLTGAFPYTQEQILQIEQMELKVLYMQNESAELPVGVECAELTVCNGLFLHHPLEELPALRMIQLTSAGLDRVPLEAIKAKGIQLFNARGVYSIPMAEWAVMRVLEFYKQATFFAVNQEKHSWEKHRGLKEINGKIVGIVGAGNVGGEVAKRFQCFGADCVGYDVFDVKSPFFSRVEKIDKFSEQIESLDIVVLTAPHTPETHHMIDKSLLLKMKKDAVIVNIARGGLIDEKGMIEALSERTDIKAALDVFEVEPIVAESPLWDMQNVAVSPHNSFVSDQNNARLFKLIKENIQLYLSKK